MVFHIFLLPFFYCSGQAQQHVEWAKAIVPNVVSSSVSPASIRIGGSGNIYETGIFQGTVDFDPGTEIFELTATYPNTSFYLKCSNPDGKFLWAVAYEGTINCEVSDIAITSKENIIITGHVSGNLIVLKYDADGTLIWKRQLDGPYSEGQALGADDFENVYIVGYFQATVDFDPGLGIANKTTFGYTGSHIIPQDGYVLSLNSNGDFRWVRQFGGTSADLMVDLIVDSQQNVAVTGHFKGRAHLGTGYYYSKGYSDAFVSKLDSNGNMIWTDVVATGGYDYSFFITKDNMDNLYVSGEKQNQRVIRKLDKNGKELWVVYLDGKVSDISSDSENSIFVVGSFSNHIDADPSENERFLYSLGGRDIYYIELDANGSHISSGAFGSEYYCAGASIVSRNRNTYLVGEFRDQAKFGPLASNQLDGTSAYNGFFTKLADCFLTSGEFSVASCNNFISDSDNMYTESGKYSEVYPNWLGCDSLVTLDVTILTESQYEYNAVSCDYYSPEYTNKTYLDSGLYLDTLTNSLGCDSLVYLNLTINRPDKTFLNIEVCDSYISSLGEKYTESGMYTDNFHNVFGCDSIVNYDLSILKSTSSQIEIISCDGYISPNTDLLYLETGEYMEIIENIAGCDSIITINYTNYTKYEEVLIPNVITPNKDDFNDQFEVDSRLAGSELKIFNRWGILQFHSLNYNNDWQGNGLSSGVYYYTLKDECGKTYKGVLSILK